MRIGEEDVLGVEEVGGDFGGFLGEYVEVGLDGDGLVEVFDVGAVPAEGLGAAAFFEAGGVDVATFEEGVVLLGPVLADGADEADGGEEGGGVGEVDGGAADDVVALAEGGFDGVDADGAGDEEGYRSSCPVVSCQL